MDLSRRGFLSYIAVWRSICTAGSMGVLSHSNTTIEILLASATRLVVWLTQWHAGCSRQAIHFATLHKLPWLQMEASYVLQNSLLWAGRQQACSPGREPSARCRCRHQAETRDGTTS
jgi:hypothetical protein